MLSAVCSCLRLSEWNPRERSVCLCVLGIVSGAARIARGCLAGLMPLNSTVARSVRFQQKHVPQLRCTSTVSTITFSRGNKTASRSSQIVSACEAAPRRRRCCCLSQIGIVLFCKPPFSAKGQPLKSKLWLLHQVHFLPVTLLCFLGNHRRKADRKEDAQQKKRKKS